MIPPKERIGTTRLIPKIPSDPEFIFKAAECFNVVANLTNHDGNYLAQSIVNDALSLELYLKCLILLEGNKYGRAHDLVKLFKLLRSGSQVWIKNRYNTLHLNNIVTFLHEIHDRKGVPIPTRIDFEFIMETSKIAFQNYRYHYEKGPSQLGSWLATGVAECVCAMILTKHPEWEKPFTITLNLTGTPHTFQRRREQTLSFSPSLPP